MNHHVCSLGPPAWASQARDLLESCIFQFRIFWHGQLSFFASDWVANAADERHLGSLLPLQYASASQRPGSPHDIWPPHCGQLSHNHCIAFCVLRHGVQCSLKLPWALLTVASYSSILLKRLLFQLSLRLCSFRFFVRIGAVSLSRQRNVGFPPARFAFHFGFSVYASVPRSCFPCSAWFA